MILNWVLALASALLLVLLFPPFGLAWLSPVALVPLLIACIRETRWRWRFAYGYAAGLVYWFGLCHWIQWTLEHHGGMGRAVAWFLFVLFCFAKAIQMGLFAALSGFAIRRWFGIPAIGSLWVALEWTHSYTGFEWLNLGNAAADLSLPLRLAPLTGVWGVSFLLALASTIAAALLARARPWTDAAWLLVFPCLLLVPQLPAPTAGRAAAVIVQPNIDDEAVWSQQMLNDTERQMRAYSLSAPNSHPDIIVWPEVPAPFYENDPDFNRLVAGVAKQTNAAVLSGVVAHAGAHGPPLNSAMLTNAQGEHVSRYDKVNLVPFGEFVPWPFGLIAEKVSTEAGDFAPGRTVVVSPLTGTVGSHYEGTFICYESVFPSYIRQFAAGGAQVLFNISNDSWFGKTAARYQHLQIVRMRAAENDRWIVRSTNDGVSGVVDPAGRVTRTLPEYREAAALLPYDYVTKTTLYTRHGDWFVALCWACSIAALAACAVRAGRPPARESLR